MNKQKSKAARILPAALLLILAAIVAAIIIAYKIFAAPSAITSSVRPSDKYPGDVEQVHSTVDFDSDGIDDQLDILGGALDYVATRPLYRSAYFEGGYPTDGTGVCTDVVAQAFLAAGYNLRDLVDADIAAAAAGITLYRDSAAALPDYNIEAADPNIDFRRVKNLKVFFARNATALTTDLSDVTAWQGGDIVIFEKHIGIISDRRNSRGVPYVIHHNSPAQKSYEQDILEKREDIVGHYRWR